MARYRKLALFIIGALAIALLVVWYAVVAEERNGVLTVAFLDVGQGDAIFIDSPTGRQVLIDGGPGRGVLRELSSVMPFYDRSIDVVLATHPDADHIGGLVDVLERYRVSFVIRPGISNDTPISSSFIERTKSEKAEEIFARRGQVFYLGSGARLEILFPDRDVSDVETNTGSIVARLVYGDVSFIFTGDSPQAIEEYLLALDGEALAADVLKAGHHGSRTSSGELFVGFVRPKYAVLSYGCDNQYGHPHAEVLDTLNKFEIDTIDTCTKGTIIFKTDGSNLIVGR
jgi:competence protein ComEC